MFRLPSQIAITYNTEEHMIRKGDAECRVDDEIAGKRPSVQESPLLLALPCLPVVAGRTCQIRCKGFVPQTQLQQAASLNAPLFESYLYSSDDHNEQSYEFEPWIFFRSYLNKTLMAVTV